LTRTKKLAVIVLSLALAGLGVTAAAQNTITVGGKAYVIGEDAIPAMQSVQAPQATPAPLSPNRLQQMVAPIALYPDSLVSQILIASTYPVEVVEAYQWSQDNKSLPAAQAQQAVQSKPWDPSVQSLVQFPQILDRMYHGLDWTQDLGEAFLSQQADIMDAVQAMRQKAQAAGNLETSTQQTVTQQGADIVIQPADPEVVYLPAYDPTEVYGAWDPSEWYYSPYVYGPWPGYYPGSRALAFGVGVAVGAAWRNAYNCNWARGNVNVNPNYYHGSYGTPNGPGGSVHGANGSVGHYGNTTAAYNKNTGQVKTYNSATGNTRSGNANDMGRGFSQQSAQAYGASRGYGEGSAADRGYGEGGAADRGYGEGGGGDRSVQSFEGLHSGGGGDGERAASDRGWDSRGGGSADWGGASAGNMNRGGGFSGGGGGGGYRGGGGGRGGGGRR
jgi:hypothetical protein